MDETKLLTYQDRLDVVFRLKIDLLHNVIIGRYKISPKDMNNLVSDLIEIRLKKGKNQYAGEEKA